MPAKTTHPCPLWLPRWLRAGAAVMAVACTPELPNEAAPSFVELEFDPDEGKTSQPTSLVVNADTGLIDLSLAGIDVPSPDDPSGCEQQTALSLAQCEFYQYLERLDGFPSLAAATTPSSAPLDLITATSGQNVVVYNVQQPAPALAFEVAYDPSSKLLAIDPIAGWDIGATYVVGLRGYRDGIKSTTGAEAVASVIYALLKSPTSLSCGATRVDQIDASCGYYGLLVNDPKFAELPSALQRPAIAQDLLELEQLRLYYRGETASMPFNLWATLQSVAGMPEDEVAIGWFFPIHTASVVELDPKRGMVPTVSAANEIRLAVKGSLDPRSLSAFSLQSSRGTVFLLDVDVLQQNPLDPRALPPFESTYVDGQIVLTASDAENGLIDGDTYAVLLTDELTDARGAPLVASPVTVLLRTRGNLVNDQGLSQVNGVSDADALQLEQARLQFVTLLDDPLLQNATVSPSRPQGLTREGMTYLFAFPYSAP